MHASYNIASSLREQARKNPYQQAVIFPALSHKQRTCYTQLNYKQLDVKSSQIASELATFGIKKKMRCVLMVPPSLEFFALTFALFKLGAIPVFIDPGLGVRKIGSCLDKISAQAFIGIPKAHLARVLFGWNKLKWQNLIIIDGKFPGAKQLTNQAEIPLDSPTGSIARCLPDDPAAILFTSGSTGAPKGVLYSHANFAAQIELLRSTYQIKPGEIDLCTFPLFALFAPALGMSAVIPDMNFTRPGKVNPDKIFEAIDNFGVQNMFGSPALIRRVADKAISQNRTFPTLKRVISAGAPVPSELSLTMNALLENGATLHTPYGATESLPVSSIDGVTIINATRSLSESGSGICVGQATKSTGFATEIRIIRISDKPIEKWSEDLLAPNGSIGEIVVKGAQVTKSYYADDAATALAKIPTVSGFYHRMGDLGYIDESGHLWYCGRKSHRVETKDKLYFTIPCESVFNRHEKVFRSALVAIKKQGITKPLICIELHHTKINKLEAETIKQELLTIADAYEHTRGITDLLFHKGFPVDIRHNSKIFREKLSLWAQKRCK